MADKKITQLENITALDGTENLVFVQNNETKKGTVNDITNYLVPTILETKSGETVDLNNAKYDNSALIRLYWGGVNGTSILNLPRASDNTNRIIRLISDDGFTTATRVELTPIDNDTLDGSTSAYIINKAYEGVQVWSDGEQWFIIQKKA